MKNTEAAVYSALGLCAKAGKLVSGETATLEAIRSGKAALAIVSCDASEGTTKKFRDKCRSYGITLSCFGTKEGLGRAIGRQERSCLAVTDSGMARMVIDKADSCPAWRLSNLTHYGGEENGED